MERIRIAILCLVIVVVPAQPMSGLDCACANQHDSVAADMMATPDPMAHKHSESIDHQLVVDHQNSNCGNDLAACKCSFCNHTVMFPGTPSTSTLSKSKVLAAVPPAYSGPIPTPAFRPPISG